MNNANIIRIVIDKQSSGVFRVLCSNDRSWFRGSRYHDNPTPASVTRLRRYLNKHKRTWKERPQAASNDMYIANDYERQP